MGFYKGSKIGMFHSNMETESNERIPTREKKLRVVMYLAWESVGITWEKKTREIRQHFAPGAGGPHAEGVGGGRRACPDKKKFCK